MQTKGYVHLYTGNGKGKTTAALGLALRAIGAGKSVFMAQFVKGMHYSEIESIKNIPAIKLQQFGLDCFIKNEPTQKDIDAAKTGFKTAAEMVLKNKYDIVILDEICIALHYNLLDVAKVIELLKNKPYEMEIVLTGRYATQELFETADLITEMKEIKHYFRNGVEARKGIEF